jgi:hypothetical protein
MQKKKPNPEMIDKENPEWTKAAFKVAVPLSGLPKSTQKVLSNRGKRSPQKSPKGVSQ